MLGQCQADSSLFLTIKTFPYKLKYKQKMLY